jgi:hypothetical protein
LDQPFSDIAWLPVIQDELKSLNLGLPVFPYPLQKFYFVGIFMHVYIISDARQQMNGPSLEIA